MDTLVLLRKGNKIPMEGDTETTCGAQTKGKTIQKLLYLGIYLIFSYQTQILLCMPTSACYPDPDIDDS